VKHAKADLGFGHPTSVPGFSKQRQRLPEVGQRGIELAQLLVAHSCPVASEPLHPGVANIEPSRHRLVGRGESRVRLSEHELDPRQM
jgi:hypothetical protein